MKKSAGWILALLGLWFLISGYWMDTTVATVGGPVHNIGLMQQRQVDMIGGAAAFLAGVILLVAFGRRSHQESPGEGRARRQCPSCAEMVLVEAKACRFCNVQLPAVSEPVLGQLPLPPNEWAENKGFLLGIGAVVALMLAAKYLL